MFRYFTISALILLSAISCKQSKGEPIDLYHEYFPLEIGQWISYDVIQIDHDIDSDTTIFQLKEIVAGEFIDDEGRVAHRIERFWREDSTQVWQIKDVWSSVRTTTQAEKVEEDERFIKMVFPVGPFKQWDGNAKNTRSRWDYNFEDIDQPKVISGTGFDSTLVVVRRDNFNFAEYEQVREIYAKNIGLVHSKYVDLDISADTTSIMKGIEYHQRLLDFGF